MKRKRIITGFIIALMVSLLVSLFASELPDGMEKVMEKLGISSRQQGASTDSYPLSEYRFPGVNSPIASTALAALIGMAVVYGFVITTGTLLRKYRDKEREKPNKSKAIKDKNRP